MHTKGRRSQWKVCGWTNPEDWPPTPQATFSDALETTVRFLCHHCGNMAVTAANRVQALDSSLLRVPLRLPLGPSLVHTHCVTLAGLANKDQIVQPTAMQLLVTAPPAQGERSHVIPQYVL
eukprot:6488879-Amphidinium_carterae.1